MAQIATTDDITGPYERHEKVKAAVEVAKKLVQQKKKFSDIVSKAHATDPYEELQWVDLVTAGGGMLGVGLLGYTYILEQVGIRFVGLGGTSAGAINTMLIATRRGTPDKPCSLTLLKVMAQMPFTKFMDGPSDTDTKLNQKAHDMTMKAVDWKRKQDADEAAAEAVKVAEKQSGGVAKENVSGNKPAADKGEKGEKGLFESFQTAFDKLPIVAFLFNNRNVIQAAFDAGGLHRGKEFESWMQDNIGGITNVQGLKDTLKLEGLGLAIRKGAEGDVEGSQIPKEGVLNIVASDITTQTRAVFPKDAEAYWAPGEVNPARFVRASMSIPFFFTPMKVGPVPYVGESALKHHPPWQAYDGEIPKEVIFVDGGMLSNFPMDLFNRLDKVPLYPTFGVQLGNRPDTAQEVHNPAQFLEAIINSGRHILDRNYLETHDEQYSVIGKINTDLFHWLDFNMKTEDRIALFAEGAKAAAEFLTKFDWQVYKGFRQGLKEARAKAPAAGRKTLLPVIQK